MRQAFKYVAVALTLFLSTGSVALAEEKLLGVVTKLDVAKDGGSAVATLKDSKNGQTFDIAVDDKITLDKFKDHRIGIGDEIKCKYEKQGPKNHATYFKKAAGC